MTAIAVSISPFGLEIVSGSVRADGEDIALTQIPDANFRAVLADEFYDSNQDGILSQEERNATTFMNCSASSINSLSGIEYFPNLEYLACSDNNLTGLNLSSNTALTELYCYNNRLQSLDIRYCTELTELQCYGNELTSLDISKNISLSSLDCSGNALTTLNLNTNTLLGKLNCSDNALSALNVEKNTLLSYLSVRENPLTTLDISKSYKIANAFRVSDLQDKGWYYLFSKVDTYGQEIYLDFGWNVTLQGYTIPERMAYISVENGVFTDPAFCEYVKRFDYDGDGFFTLGELESVESINCSDMGIENLNGISYFTELRELECDNNQIQFLYLNNNTKLETLYCWCNPLMVLDIRDNSELQYLDVQYCELDQLDLSANRKIYFLNVSGCPLESLDVTCNTALRILITSYTDLPKLNIQCCTALANCFDENEVIDQGDCFLFEHEADDENPYCFLQFDKKTTLEGYTLPEPVIVVTIDDTSFPDKNFRDYVRTFDFDGDGAFSEAELNFVSDITCENLGIKSLEGIGYFTGLQSLDCAYNEITGMDLSANVNLRFLYANDTAITELDVSNNTMLKQLFVERCPLTDLNLSENSRLTSLDIRETEISSIDIRSCTSLMQVFDVDLLKDNGDYFSFEFTDDADNEYSLAFSKDTTLTGITIPDPVPVLEINETNFPDENFRNFVKKYDFDKDGSFSQAELDSVTYLSCSYAEITSLQGIGYFTKLEALYCCGNEFNEVDLSQNTKLQLLYIFDTPLETLDLSNNTELVELDVERCPLTGLSLTSNPKLKSLDIRETLISDMDIRDCTSLVSVFTVDELADKGKYYSFEKQVDEDTHYLFMFSKTTALTGYALPEPNPVLIIDETTFPDSVFRDYISQFDYDSDGYLSQGEMDSVEEIYCSYMGIFDLAGIENFTNLKSLNCEGNFIETVDLGSFTDLESLVITGNPVSSIDVSLNSKLSNFNAENCPLAELVLTQNPLLTNINVVNTQISSLDISNCALLTAVFKVEDMEDHGSFFSFNYSEGDESDEYSLLIGKKTALAGYTLPQPVAVVNITTENFPDPEFRDLIEQYDYDDSGSFSQIELDSVEWLDCSYRNIANLKGIEYFTKLVYLNASTCELSELHLDQNVLLQTVYCSNNHLKELDISNNPDLYVLEVQSNLLSSLDISGCPKLVSMCSNTDPQSDASCYYFNMSGEDYEEYYLTFDKRTQLAGYDLPTVFALDVDETNFPDPYFCSLVSMFDTDGNAWLSQEELDAVTSIYSYNDSIQSMEGIAYFTNLTSLTTMENPLTSLDLSSNVNLQTVFISNANFTSLDLSSNQSIKEFSCMNSAISNLTLGNNTQLITLTVIQNGNLTGLDLSGCTALESLDVSGNNLVGLDLSKNTELTLLDCSSNNLNSLNVSELTKLREIYCFGNNIASLDLSKNTSLVSLECHKNALTSLDLSNNTLLECLTVHDNAIPSLEIYKCPKLVKVYTEEEVMEYETYFMYEHYYGGENDPYLVLSFSKSTEIVSVDPYIAPRVQINETNFPDEKFRSYLGKYDLNLDGWFSQKELDAVTGMDCSNLEIGSLAGLEHFTNLKTLLCAGNALTTLDVSANTMLTLLDCSNNAITGLDLSSNTALVTLCVNNNDLTDLNVSMLTSLTRLLCRENQISELFVSNNVALEELDCADNQLDSLNVKKLTELRKLRCNKNQLATLDVSKNTKLEVLAVEENALTALDVQSCPILVSLITSTAPVDVSGIRTIQGNVAVSAELVVDAILSLDLAAGLTPESPFDITPTPTNSPTPVPPTPTKKATNTPTNSPTPTKKATNTPTNSPTPTKKATNTPTNTPTPTKKATLTPTKKATPTPTKKATPTPTKKATPTPTKKATPTPTKKATPTPTKKATPTPTKKATPTPTKKATPTPTKKATPTPTKKATPTPTKKATPTPTKKATPTPTKKATPTPTKKATPTPTKKATPTPTKKATPTPTKKATPTPTKKATPTPTKKATPTPTKKATPTPTKKATPTPTKKATPTPTKKATPTPTKKATPTPTKAPSFEDFVERLYVVALNRASDPSGKAYWVKQVKEKQKTGGDCARFFLLDAPEFMNRNLSVEDFVETLYKTFFDRASDPAGKKGWVDAIKSGAKSRSEVVNDFIESDEWVDVCNTYGVESGAKYHFGTHR